MEQTASKVGSFGLGKKVNAEQAASKAERVLHPLVWTLA
jgi:hypothetical protein